MQGSVSSICCSCQLRLDLALHSTRATASAAAQRRARSRRGRSRAEFLFHPMLSCPFRYLPSARIPNPSRSVITRKRPSYHALGLSDVESAHAAMQPDHRRLDLRERDGAEVLRPARSSCRRRRRDVRVRQGEAATGGGECGGIDRALGRCGRRAVGPGVCSAGRSGPFPARPILTVRAGCRRHARAARSGVPVRFGTRVPETIISSVMPSEPL